MSQLVLDDQLDVLKLLPGLRRWISAIRLQQLRPGEHILDDRVPEILLACHQPTFVTIDSGFWDRRLCHPGYCVVVAEVDSRRQELIPGLLRQLLRHKQFKFRAQRMGKVIRLGRSGIWFWEIGATTFKQARLTSTRARRRKRP